MLDIVLDAHKWDKLKKTLTEWYGLNHMVDYEELGHLPMWKEWFAERGATYQEDAPPLSEATYYWGRIQFNNEHDRLVFILSHQGFEFLFEGNTEE